MNAIFPLPHPRQLVLRFQSLTRRLPARWRGVLTTSIYGLAAGISAVAFQKCMNWVYEAGLVNLSQHSPIAFYVGSFLILIGTSLVVGWLLNSFCPEAAGSGIPQLKLAFWKDFGFVPWRVVWVKFLAGVLSIGGGSSMGREGPSVQLGGAVASNLGALAGEAKQTRRAPAAAGAAAGLAAAFNTPLAATTFVLEEIIGDLNSRLLGPVLLASVIGAMVVHGIIGKQPAFTLVNADSPSWVGYALTPVVAAAASLIGVAFQRGSLGLRYLTRKQRYMPAWMTPALGGLVTWCLGSLIFWQTGHLGVFALGYGDLSRALAGDLGWKLAAALLLAKFVATTACYGFGGCGGIFSPTLFFGGMVGFAVSGLAGLEWSVSHADMLTLCVVGMSACLGAVVFAPVTGILIVFEMTHEFALVPALMLGALVSQAISRTMSHENFYDALLTQDGHRLEHVKPPRDLYGWQQFPVSAIANFQPVVINDLSAPAIRKVLRAHPYQQFPVVKDGKLAGVLTRKSVEAAFTDGSSPALAPAATCLRDNSVADLQKLLIESETHFVVLLDHAEGNVIGLVTLHDLLRAETALGQQSKQD